MVKVTRCPSVGDTVKVFRGKYAGAVGKVLQFASVWGEASHKWSSFRLDIGGTEVWVRSAYVQKQENAA